MWPNVLVLVPFDLLCKRTKQDVSKYIFYESTAHDPQAGEYALNHTHEHLHGVNHNSIKHFFHPGVSCCRGELRVETVYGARLLVTGLCLLLFSLFFQSKC